jgi:hypothetical protein
MPEETQEQRTLADEIIKQEEKKDEISEEAAQEQLQKMLEAKFQRDRQKCWEELVQILNKYKMRFEVVTLLRANNIMHNIDLVGQAEQPQQQ